MMASSTSMKENDIGIIILGNTGAGKSFLCNLIIGEAVFTADFQPDAVTTITRHHRLVGNPCDILIYDIPGLIEIDQERIDQNKKEINKAFAQCPKSYVLFVWRQFGGRLVNEDIIAFNALNKAYDFPPECLLHVLNNIPVSRPADSEVMFMLILSNQLKEINISVENMFFLENLDPTNEHKRNENRVKLFHFLRNGKPHAQKPDGEIILQLDEIEALTETLKAQEEKFEKELEALKDGMKRVIDGYRVASRTGGETYKNCLAISGALSNEAENRALSMTGYGKLISLYDEHMKEREKLVNEYNQSKENTKKQSLELFGDVENGGWSTQLSDAHHQMKLEKLKSAFLDQVKRTVREDSGPCIIL